MTNEWTPEKQAVIDAATSWREVWRGNERLVDSIHADLIAAVDALLPFKQWSSHVWINAPRGSRDVIFHGVLDGELAFITEDIDRYFLGENERLTPLLEDDGSPAHHLWSPMHPDNRP